MFKGNFVVTFDGNVFEIFSYDVAMIVFSSNPYNVEVKHSTLKQYTVYSMFLILDVISVTDETKFGGRLQLQSYVEIYITSILLGKF